MSERFEVNINDVYFNGYCQYDECMGGFDINVVDTNTGDTIAAIEDEECFMYSGEKKKVWMGDLQDVVGDVMSQIEGYVTEAEGEAIKLDLRTQMKNAIVSQTIAEWYTEPDYVEGWDDIEVAA